jgi:hypothetical protein
VHVFEKLLLVGLIQKLPPMQLPPMIFGPAVQLRVVFHVLFGPLSAGHVPTLNVLLKILL